jgi:hypothetical protein
LGSTAQPYTAATRAAKFNVAAANMDWERGSRLRDYMQARWCGKARGALCVPAGTESACILPYAAGNTAAAAAAPKEEHVTASYCMPHSTVCAPSLLHSRHVNGLPVRFMRPVANTSRARQCWKKNCTPVSNKGAAQHKHGCIHAPGPGVKGYALWCQCMRH